MTRAAGIGLVASAVLGYLLHILSTALFHVRYIRTQREFLVNPRPWRHFTLIAICELMGVYLTAAWLNWRVTDLHPAELILFAFAAGTLVRYVLRKELLEDIRGLRREIRLDDVA